jgi:hypothetical protein
LLLVGGADVDRSITPQTTFSMIDSRNDGFLVFRILLKSVSTPTGFTSVVCETPLGFNFRAPTRENLWKDSEFFRVDSVAGNRTRTARPVYSTKRVQYGIFTRFSLAHSK